MAIYNESHFSYKDQVRLLKDKGLTIGNNDFALDFLKSVSYQRLKPYLHFYKCSPQGSDSRFINGTKFEDIVCLYNFDSELRLLSFGFLEKVEIFLRNQIAYNLSEKYGAFPLHSLSKEKTGHLKQVNSEINNFMDSPTKNPSIRTFTDKYKNNIPPIWLVMEVLSFGTLSKMYDILGKDIKENIADSVGFSETVFRLRYLLVLEIYVPTIADCGI